MEHLSALCAAFRVRDAIVSVLADEFPLTVAQLRVMIYRRFGVRASYQSIHKETVRMLSQRILRRDGRQLRLNPEWIARQEEFFRSAHMNYLGATRVQDEPLLRKQPEELRHILLE